MIPNKNRRRDNRDRKKQSRRDRRNRDRRERGIKAGRIGDNKYRKRIGI